MKRFIVYSIGEGCDVYLDIVPAETMPAAEAKVGDLRQCAEERAGLEDDDDADDTEWGAQ